MTLETLASDFYAYESLLTDREQEALANLRTWLEAEVKPIAGDYWDRAEFPMQVVKPLADLGTLSNGFVSSHAYESVPSSASGFTTCIGNSARSQ